MDGITFSAVYLPLLLSALTLIICIVSVIFLRAYIKRRTSKEWIVQKGIMAEISEGVQSLVKSIDETADRDITLITEKEKNLRSLLDELDKRFKVYIREMDKRPAYSAMQAMTLPGTESPAVARTGQPVYSTEPPSGVASMMRGSPLDSNGASRNGQNPMDAYLDLGKLRYNVKSQEIAGIPADESLLATEPKAESPQSMSEQIYSMLKAGFSESLIASRLGLSIAEVEFTAALLERRETSNAPDRAFLQKI